jgi:uncharacterized protein DUF4189
MRRTVISRFLFTIGCALLLSATLSTPPALAQGDKFFSVAYAPSISVNAPFSGYTMEDAKNRAMTSCLDYARYYPNYANDCSAPIWVRNGWVALATDQLQFPGLHTNPWGTGWGSTEQEAKDYAMNICRQNGGSSCAQTLTWSSPSPDNRYDTAGGQ